MKTILAFFILSLSICHGQTDEICRGWVLSSMDGTPSNADSLFIELELEKDTVYTIGERGELYRWAGIGLNDGSFNWAKLIAKVEIVQQKGRTLTLKSFGNYANGSLLELVARFLEMDAPTRFELKTFEYNECPETRMPADENESYTTVGCKCGWFKKGEWKTYDATKRLLYAETFGEEEKREGRYTEFYSSGDTSLIGRYKRGRKEGEWKTFYPSGKLESLEYYEFDELEGERRTYFENGSIKSIENYGVFGDLEDTIKY